MPAFSLVQPPQLGLPAASLAARRSPTHPRTWTLKEPAATEPSTRAETPGSGTAICLNRKGPGIHANVDRKSTRLNSSHLYISYAVFCLKKTHPTTAAARPKTTRGTGRRAGGQAERG